MHIVTALFRAAAAIAIVGTATLAGALAASLATGPAAASAPAAARTLPAWLDIVPAPAAVRRQLHLKPGAVLVITPKQTYAADADGFHDPS